MKSKPNGNGAREGRLFGVLTLKPVSVSLQFTVDDVIEHRFFDCVNYDECLDVAVRKRWGNFTCRECPIWAFHKHNLEEKAASESSEED